MQLKSTMWLRVIMLLAVLTGAFGQGSLASAAPAADVVGNTYTSPTFGYQLTWSDRWYVVEEKSEEWDSLTLTDGTTYIDLIGDPVAGGSALLQLAGVLGSFRRDPQVTDFTKVAEEISPEHASGTYTYTYSESGDSLGFTSFIDIQSINAGEATVTFSAITVTDYFAGQLPYIEELLAGLHFPEPPAIIGETAPVFVSDQWRFAVASAALGETFVDQGLSAKENKEWLVVIADVTNWSTADALLKSRDFTVQTGLESKAIKAAPSSTRAVATLVALEPTTDDLTVQLAAGETKRVVLVYSVPAGSRTLILARKGVTLPLADTVKIVLDPASFTERTVPLPIVAGEIVSAADGSTLRIQLDGESKSQKLRLLGVDPPSKGECFAHEAKKVLDELAGSAVIVEEDAALTGGSTPGRYIWLVNDDGTRRLINEQLLSDGLVKAARLPADARFGAWLQQSEVIAEAGSIGLWQGCTEPAAKATTAPATAVSATATTAATTAPDETGTPVAKTSYDLTMNDIFYSETLLVVPANREITITLTNDGAAIHTFNINAFGAHSGDYAPGQTGTISFQTAGPGTYDFYCSNAGHKQAGMIGTLLVVANTDS